MEKTLKIGYHLIFWICLPTLVVFFEWANQKSASLPGLPRPHVDTFLEILNNDIGTIVVLLIIAIPIFYLSFYILTPSILFKRKLCNYFIFIAALIVYTFLIKFIFIKLFPMSFFFGTPYEIRILVPIVLLSGLGGTLYAFSEKYQRDKLDKLALEKQNYELEISVLKSTISPHFLFNTLNNIDVLITKDTKKASEYLKKLSDILRFMLYKTKNDFIPLKLELEYIKKYVDLQQLRTPNNEFINIEIKGSEKDWDIAPMIFIPFIENAFKYSSNKKVKDAIRIFFDISANKIAFQCSNNISDLINKGEENGLGIKLIEQRLKLLYKENYNLEYKETDGTFSVKLIILK